MNNIEHLILSSTLDFSSDYVCRELQRRGESYLRLNRDRFSNYRIQYFLEDQGLIVELDNDTYLINNELLRSVFFRSPVFIRSNKHYSVDEQLYRSQWSSFLRNLTVFSKARWLNHPMSVYQAENKLFQLKLARELGMLVPETIVTNDSSIFDKNNTYIVKALDTPLFYDEGKEMFTYSTVVSGEDIADSSFQEAPVIVQRCVQNKIDIRVTIVGDKLFPVKITKLDMGIEGDWRTTKKEELQYSPIKLPKSICESLLNLMSMLHLSFGGIDLAYSDGKYYFLEINPTGEWGWLIRTTGYSIDKSIVDWMTNKGE